MYVKNTSNTVITLDTLGITIPAQGKYDVGYLQPHLSKSGEFMGHLANGVIKIINNNSNPETYFDISEASALATYGVNKAALGLADLRVLQIPGQGAMLTYRDYHRNAEYMASILTMNLVVSSSSDGTWLQVSPDIYGSSIGATMTSNATITAINVFTDTLAPKAISLYIDEQEYPNSVIMTSQMYQGLNTNLNIDVPVGGKVRARVRSTNVFIRKGLGAISCQVMFQIKVA